MEESVEQQEAINQRSK